MFEMNDDWLIRTVLSSEVASIGRPHVVLVDDPTTDSVAIHGPFTTGVDACREAGLIADALDGDGAALLPPIITVVALTPPDDERTPDAMVG